MKHDENKIEELIEFCYVPDDLNGDFLDEELVKKRMKQYAEHYSEKIPITIHEGIYNTHVYIEDGRVYVKPNNNAIGGAIDSEQIRKQTIEECMKKLAIEYGCSACDDEKCAADLIERIIKALN